MVFANIVGNMMNGVNVFVSKTEVVDGQQTMLVYLIKKQSVFNYEGMARPFKEMFEIIKN